MDRTVRTATTNNTYNVFEVNARKHQKSARPQSAVASSNPTNSRRKLKKRV